MENILKPKGMLCNIRKMIKWIIVHNRVKDDCNIFQLHLILFLFTNYVELNNHDRLGVIQFLYHKSLSKHVLKSEERERIQTMKRAL